MQQVCRFATTLSIYREGSGPPPENLYPALKEAYAKDNWAVPAESTANFPRPQTSTSTALFQSYTLSV
ncbi:hypothetical protein Pyn_39925 [Prunus yedoensis var. nudiflora]|uniref:Uncharacterized protein n=1 Tax=Prunus yedoensis var. nudiflora TaxID=2094558 RepID=A0A314UQY6_PRUYE|nr:hypothetical protein Pyn_39925 [Prunus yedoensis var. nudiflora]